MTDSRAGDCVTIGDECFSLTRAPALESTLVQQQKNDLVCDIKPEVYARDIETVAYLMSIAFEAAIGLDQPDVTISVQDIGYNLTLVAERGHMTMHGLAVSANDAIGDLEAVFSELYASDGLDTVALAMLESIEKRAGGLRGQVLQISEKFYKMAEDTKAALEKTQNAISERRHELLAHRSDAAASQEVVAEASDAHRMLTQTVVESNAILAEARSRENWAHRRGAWFSFFDEVTRGFQPIFGAEASVRESVVKTRREAKQARKLVERIEVDRLVAVQRKSEALKDIVHIVQKIRNAKTQADHAAVLIEALHKAAGALKRLSANMLKTASLWAQLEGQAARLEKPDVSELVRSACSAYPVNDERRTQFWRSTAFKRRSVIYMSRWVALAFVGQSYTGPLAQARRTLYNFLEAHPEYSTVAEHMEAW